MCEREWRNAQDYEVKQGLAAGSRRGLAACKPPEDAHKWSMQKSWTVMPTIALQDKKSRLAIQLARSLDSRLSQVARPSHQSIILWKNWLFAFLSHFGINTLYTHKILRASRENFERETLEKKRLTHPQSLHSDSSNFSTLILSIVTSLKDSLTKSFSHLTHICEKAFWCFGKQFRRDQFTLVDAMGYSGIW